MPLTVNQIAALLKVSNNKVYDLIAREHLPAVRVHGDYTVHPDALFDWANETDHCLPRAYFSADVEAAHAGLLDALALGSAVRHPVPDSPRGVAEVLLRSLPLPASASVEVLAEVVAARPTLGFHLVADPIAVPRIGEPLIVDADPAISVCVFASPPVPGLAATVFVSVMAPTVRAHHRLLGELLTALHEPQVRARCVAGAPLSELAATIDAVVPIDAVAK